jgi:MFS family permease
MGRTKQNIILAVMTLSGFISTFTASSINIALPLIEDEFHVSAVVLDWITFTFVLAAAAVIMPVGRIADYLGRMRLFLVGMAAFAILSFASAFAPSAAALLAIRTLHGLASALLFATNIALVTLSQPASTRGRALGLLTAGVYLGSTAGPVLGGVIAQDLGWRGLFVFVGVISLVNFAPAIWKLHGIDWKEPKRAPFDAVGSSTWAVSFPTLLVGLTFLPDLTGIVLVGAGFVGMVLFLCWETRAADPILDVELLRRNRVFALANFATLTNYSATFAMTFLMSLYLQYNRGLGPRTAGFVLVSGMFLQAVVSPIAGRLADRLQPRSVAATGMSLSALGLLAFAFLGETTPYWYIVPTLCTLGIGFGLFASPMAHTVMGSVENRYVGTASATLATMRLAGHSTSMGIAGLVLALVVGRHGFEPADYPNLLTSIRTSFAIFAAICALGLVAVLLTPRRQQPSGNASS